MGRWLVQLEGHQFDLEDLQEHFKASGVSVRKEPEGFVLDWGGFDDLPPPTMVSEAAESLIPRLNGAMAAHLPGFERVRAGPVLENLGDGSRRRHHIMRNPICVGGWVGYVVKWDADRHGYAVWDTASKAWAGGQPVFGQERVAQGIADDLNERVRRRSKSDTGTDGGR